MMRTTSIAASLLLSLAVGCSDDSSGNKEPAANTEVTEEGPVNFAFEDGESIPVFIRGELNGWGGDWNGDLALAQASGSEMVWADDCYTGSFTLAEGLNIFKFASNHPSWYNLNIGGYNFEDGSEDVLSSTVVVDEPFLLNVDYQAARGAPTGNPAALRFEAAAAGEYAMEICFEERDLFQAVLTVTAAE